MFSRTAKHPQPCLSSGFQGVSQSPQPCLGSGFQGVIILVITRKEIRSVALPPIVSSLYQSLEKPQQSPRAWGRVRPRTGNTEMVSAGERTPCVGTWNSVDWTIKHCPDFLKFSEQLTGKAFLPRSQGGKIKRKLQELLQVWGQWLGEAETFSGHLSFGH